MPNKDKSKAVPAGSKEARSSSPHKFRMPEVPKPRSKKADMGTQSASSSADQFTQTPDSLPPVMSSYSQFRASVFRLMGVMNSIMARKVQRMLANTNPGNVETTRLLRSALDALTGNLTAVAEFQAEQNPDGEPPAKRRKLERSQDS
ncbi:uncharacterized protein LOC113564528 [Drosophila erecta]|uniref:uncharacterized protein LOC113564528 n=1 Tax=Drosophila erecta TaxID=7220 RepID=UPI00017813CC|nr:uncharacterized protein LOC113564528 [Drosophila erecta]